MSGATSAVSLEIGRRRSLATNLRHTRQSCLIPTQHSSVDDTKHKPLLSCTNPTAQSAAAVILLCSKNFHDNSSQISVSQTRRLSLLVQLVTHALLSSCLTHSVPRHEPQYTSRGESVAFSLPTRLRSVLMRSERTSKCSTSWSILFRGFENYCLFQFLVFFISGRPRGNLNYCCNNDSSRPGSRQGAFCIHSSIMGRTFVL